jgi:bifunctional non-homologous end joining protein LigD
MEITHPDKILFPELEWTKNDVVHFYLEISEHLLPYLKNRPCVIQCFPNGIQESGYYQQEVPDHYPEWIDTIQVERKEKDKQNMLEIHTRRVLKYIVNQNGICFHTWHSQQDRLNQPDLLIFDLDPPGGDFSSVAKVAQSLRSHIEELGGHAYVMTTGSSGLHVSVPIKPDNEFEEVRQGAKAIAEAFIDQHPDLTTLEIRKNKREGKIFLDFLRNSYGQTSITPYSLRAAKNAPVATPLDWDELSNKKLDSQTFHAKNLLKRLSQKEDPWKEMSKHRCSLETLLSNFKPASVNHDK